MSWMEIELEGGRTSYRPGEEVVGKVAWSLEALPGEGGAAAPPEHAEVRLGWFTAGAGDQDAAVVATVELPHPAPSDWREFRLRLPAGPYSVEGRLVTIRWAVEAALEPAGPTERVEIVVSPTGQPVRLHRDPPAEPGPDRGGG